MGALPEGGGGCRSPHKVKHSTVCAARELLVSAAAADVFLFSAPFTPPTCGVRRTDQYRDGALTVTPRRAVQDAFGRERRLVLNLDLHAHSRRCNVFAYGCAAKNRPAAAAAGAHRVFPTLAAEVWGPAPGAVLSCVMLALCLLLAGMGDVCRAFPPGGIGRK